MLFYNYDSKTKEYIGSEEAYLDPEETKVQGHEVYCLPANATFTKPPKTKEHQVAIYNDGWSKVSDYRNEYIVNSDMNPIIQKELGDLPEGYICITAEEAEKIQEDPLYYVISDGELIINPNYEQEQADIREANFKSKFFNIEGFGWYRKQPKGYQSAVESMNVLFNIANVSNGIQAGLIIFYQQPDFTKPEECTEEWLVEHQIIQPTMTKAEFMALYVAFMTAWNTEEHE